MHERRKIAYVDGIVWVKRKYVAIESVRFVVVLFHLVQEQRKVA